MDAAPTEPELVDFPGATVAVIAGTIPAEEMAAFFDRSYGRLAEVAGGQGVAIAGPAFARFHSQPGETVDLEAGFPTDGAVEPDGDVRPGSLPAGRVARFVHHGSFDGLFAAWDRLRAWADEQGLSVSAAPWEVYVTEPSPDMDPADLRTELNLPVDA